MRCRVLCIRGEEFTGSPVRYVGDRRGGGQLFIAELLKQLQGLLARSSQVRGKRLNTVVVVSIDVSLIALV